MTTPRLILLLPETISEALVAAVGAVLQRRAVDVMVLPRMTDDAALASAVRQLLPLAREHDVALLLDVPTDTRLVARLGADGAQYPFDHPGLADAIDALKPDRIVGVTGLTTRHDAMEAGEKNIDYVLFGAPKPDGYVPDQAKTADRSQWWSEIFNVPCVAYAAGVDAVPQMVDTKADFIALGPWLFADDAVATLDAVTGLLRSSGETKAQ